MRLVGSDWAKQSAPAMAVSRHTLIPYWRQSRVERRYIRSPPRAFQGSSTLTILDQHSDLVEELAREYDVPLRVLEQLLKRETALGRAATDSSPIRQQDAAEDLHGFLTRAGPGSPLRLLSLTTENLCPSSRVADDAMTPPDLRLETSGLELSPPDMLKLLLLGTEDVDVLTVGFPPMTLPRHEYVLGAPGIWPGLLRSILASPDATARIWADFDCDGNGFAVERAWRFEGPDWLEELRVHVDGICHVGRGAEAWLSGVFPSALVPLFAYDVSDVSALMLSQLRRRQALDRLYPAAFLEGLISSIRTEGMRNGGTRRSRLNQDSEIAALRRRLSHAGRMQEAAENRIKSLRNEFAAAETAQRCMMESGGILSPREPTLRRRGKSSITIPEPLSRGGEDTVGASIVDRSPPDDRNDTSDCLSARLSDLAAEMDDLRGRIETALEDRDGWSRSVEACRWKLRAYVAEKTLAAASQPPELAEADRAVRCLEELARRLRQRSRDEVRAALSSYSSLLCLSAGCALELDLDDQDGLRLTVGQRPSEGMGAFIEERAAFLLIRALQEVSRCPMPVFADVDPRQLYERNRPWLKTHYAPLFHQGTIILSSSDSSGRLERGRTRIDNPTPAGAES